jgi:two-component system, chemotaxis family, response regulator Rcp1
MNSGRVERKSTDILLVEDNPVDILVTRTALEECGFDFQLHVAEDGEEALDFLFRNCKSTVSNGRCPDLILLDINLPRKNGKEVLAAIKQRPETLHIPVVILTSSNDNKDIHESYSLHASCYITKPVDFVNFTKAVQCIGGFWMALAKLPSRN